MGKADFKKRDKALYSGKTGRFDVLTVQPIPYLMIDGKGNPNSSPAYAKAITALYPLAYSLKFFSKQKLGRDYAVPPLEGLWWADDMSTFISRQKDQWLWTMMIRQPDWITDQMVEQIRQQIIEKSARKKDCSTDINMLQRIRLQTLDEGLCVQVLHVGSYDDEGPILKQMHEQFIPGNGYTMTGKHHEIYLSDMRKVAPAKYKTILRQPVQKLNPGENHV